MGRFVIETPTGRRVTIEAADEATARRGAQEWETANPPQPRRGGGVLATAQGAADTLMGEVETMASRPLQGLARVPAVANALQAVEGAVPRYRPQGNDENALYNMGRFIPNALAPGSLGARALNVLAPFLGGEAGQAVGGDTGRMVGEIGGGFAGNVRVNRPPPTGPTPPSVRAVQGQNPRRMRAETERLRAAGANPTAADAVSVRGRRRVRDVALRGDESQEVVANFNAGRRQGLPGRIGQQSRQHLSPDSRTPDQIRDETAGRRRAQADQQFGAVRADPVALDQPTSAVLDTDYGRAAVREAASRETDPAVRAQILALADPATRNRSTVGALDRVSRVLLSQAEGNRMPDPDLARTQGIFGNNLREPARAASPGYGQALDSYAAESRVMDSATLGEDFMARNTDEFVDAASNLSDEERQVALAAARRATERASGERLGAAPGVAEQLAFTPEQHQRNVALLGSEEAAAAFERSMAAELRLTQNARAIDPQTGSQTQPNQMVAGAAEAIGTVQDTASLARGNPIPLATRALAWFTNHGFSETEATQAVQALTDPAQTDAVIAALERRLGPGAGAQLLQMIQDPRTTAPLAITTGAALSNQQ